MAALSDIADRAKAGPIEPSLGLRALLAFLFECSNGDRSPFDGFWKWCQEPNDPTKLGDMSSYMRLTYTRTQWHGIAAATGFDRTPGYHELVGKAIKTQSDRRPRRGGCGWL